MNTALLVIDVQESFRHRPFFTKDDLPAYLAAQNALIAGAAAHGVPVVRIFHRAGPETPDNPFSAASGRVRPLAGLAAFEATATFAGRATARWWAPGWTHGSRNTASAG